MTQTVIDEALLIAYVDGELSPEQCEELEQLMNASPELADQVALLMASVLPYPEAFARQAIPPVPESLTRNVDALVAQHTATNSASVITSEVPPQAPSGTAYVREQPGPEAFLNRLFGKPKIGWLVVAFALGATCYGLALQSGVIGALLNDSTVTVGHVAQIQPSAWVKQAVSYQGLYSRDTFNYVNPNMDGASRTVDDIRHLDGLALRVPDLRVAGLTFKRVQRLRFNGKALIQLVYLPDKGDPVALCVMKESMPDQPFAQTSVAGMNVTVWRQAALGYALISSPEGIDMNAVAHLVADPNSASLFTSNAPSPLWIVDIHR
nr:anti-sigma factor [uncultured Pseudomonas sp.]